MKKKMFLKAKPIFLRDFSKEEMNTSLLFVADFLKAPRLKLRISAFTCYQIYLNGHFIHYGPARSAYQIAKVDTLTLPSAFLQEKNRLTIVYSYYNCKTYTRVNDKPFFIAEILSGDQVIAHSDVDGDFVCYRNSDRAQKVIRYSYQREFSEAYHFDSKVLEALQTYGSPLPFKKEALAVQKAPTFEKRKVPSSHYAYLAFSAIERGKFTFDETLPIYDDRYIHADFLGVFPVESWELDTNKLFSQIVYEAKELNETSLLKTHEFMTYETSITRTGFIHVSLNVKEESVLHLTFDEMIQKGEKALFLDYKRDTTHNIVTYRLKPGHYELLTFEPYVLRFLRLNVEVGEVEILKTGLVILENPNIWRASLTSENQDLNRLFISAQATLAPNALDLLTDCPSRERSGWLCDTYFSGRAEGLLDGEGNVEEAFLDNYSHYVNLGEQPEGMIPMCYPADYGDKGYIVNWAMFLFLELGWYKRRYGGAKLIKALRPYAFDFLAWCQRFENEDGLIEDPEGSIFVEWSEANGLDSICGVNFPTNFLYGRFLVEIGSLYERKDLLEKGRHVLEVSRKMSYDGQFFHDNATRDSNGKLQLTNRLCETTEYYAFHFLDLKKKDYPELYEYMLKEYGPFHVHNDPLFKSNMFIGDYLRLVVLLDNGDYQTAFEEAKHLFLPLIDISGTIWEYDTTYGSLTHAFAGYLANVLVEIVSGIKWISKTKKEIHLSSYEPLDIAYELKLPLDETHVLIVHKSKGEKPEFIVPDGYKLIRDDNFSSAFPE